MQKKLQQKGLSCKLLGFAVGFAQPSTSESQKSTFSRMNPDRTERKTVCGGAPPALYTTLYIAAAGLHWNRFSFMSIIPRLFLPSPTMVHSEMVVQPFMAAFRDSPPAQAK